MKFLRNEANIYCDINDLRNPGLLFGPASALQDSDGKPLSSFLIWKTQSCLQSRWGRRCRSLDGTSSFERAQNAAISCLGTAASYRQEGNSCPLVEGKERRRLQVS
jgi:hypothetical protein